MSAAGPRRLGRRATVALAVTVLVVAVLAIPGVAYNVAFGLGQAAGYVYLAVRAVF